MSSRPAQIAERLSACHATTLWLSYHDYSGIARGKAVGADRIDDAAERGIGWAKANWDFAITDHQVPQPGFGADSGDLFLVPDPATVRTVPHRPGVAVAYGALCEPDGTRWAGDPRGRLRAIEASLSARGIHVRAAFEAEFALYLPPVRADTLPEPADRGGMFSQAAMDRQWELLAALLDGLGAMEIPVHQLAKEYGPGQYELSLLPATALEAADRWLAARDLVQAVARERGLIATFMPKPRDDLAGNGLHLHLSLQDERGNDLMADSSDQAHLSALGCAAVAGLMEHACGQAALGTPSPNSYKRLLPGSWAPAHVAWGFGNRAALVRVPSAGKGRHLEHRGGDGTANPYLHLAGICAAIADGIARELMPPTPAATDIGHLSDHEAASMGHPRLPSRLDVALDALEGDTTLTDALGSVISEHYMAVKRFEWASYLAESGLGADDTRVSDWERRAYMEVL